MATKKATKKKAKKTAAKPSGNGKLPEEFPLRLEWLDADQLDDNPQNWRTHPDEQIGALKGVLDEVGWAGALLYNERTKRLVDGHARKKISNGKKVPVLVGSWTEEQERLILATLDPIAAMARGDKNKLSELLSSLENDNKDIDRLFASLARDNKIELSNGELQEATVDVDQAEELRKKWKTELGQLWVIKGKQEHQLLCGDSSSESSVHNLMDGARADCVFTDPPYGVSIGAKNRMLDSFQKAGRNLTDINSDSLPPEALKDALLPIFRLLKSSIMSEECTLFVCSPQGGELCMMMMMMMQEACLKVRHVLIWKKNQPTFSMGRLDYDYRHEPILMTWVKRHKRPMRGQHRTSVWEVERPRASPEHPTMKPVELFVNAYLNNSDSGDAVADPFLGSGTAMVAAEQLDRRCYGIEISPAYVAVTLERMAKLGCKSELAEG